MISKIYLSIIMAFMCLASVYGQVQKKAWDRNNPLTWNDFQGNIEVNNSLDAVTRSGVEYAYDAYLNDGKYSLRFQVWANMLQNKSWVREEHKSAGLLDHEQLHFDISEFLQGNF